MGASVLFGADLEDLSYSIKYDSVIITDCKTTASGALEIPSTISGYPVTRIENAAFRSCSNLTRVSLPDGVVSIGEESFYSCSNLAEIIIPNSVSSIGESAFRYCSSLVSINLPEGLTTINESTFHGCSNLNQITIPSSVKSINERAFRDCKELSALEIPAGVEGIDRLAFYGCTKLRQIHIDGELPTFGSNVFGGASDSYVTYFGGETSIAGRPSFNPSQLIEVQSLRESIKVKDAQIAQLSFRPSIQEIQDASANSIMSYKDQETGKAKLKFNIQKTDNFETWENYDGGELKVLDEGGFELSLPLENDKQFLRVALNGEVPETFPSVGDGDINLDDLFGGGFPGIDLGVDKDENKADGETDGETDGDDRWRD